MTCIFRELKWSKKGAIDKAKVRAYFEQYETEHPDWAQAVQHVKSFCLVPELRAQGVFLNCPAYDVMQCVLSSFIKVKYLWNISSFIAFVMDRKK